MRLTFKLTFLFLAISLLVFIIGGSITYQIIKREVDFEQQRFLKERLDSSVRMIERRRPTEVFQRDKISITPLGYGPYDTFEIYSDTLVMHSTLQRVEPHVRLDAIKKVDSSYYKVMLYDLIVEEDDIIDGVQESLIKIYLLLASVVVVIGFIVSVLLLRPFNLTLEKIKKFDVKSDQPLRFNVSTTEELSKLHDFLEDMSDRVQNEYKSLKEFTENASHELQTPIAIVKGKLELLLQSENLNQEQVDLVISAQSAIQRLSKMGNSLSLLTKIDNREFTKLEDINLSQVVNDMLIEFEELIGLKGLQLEKDIEDDVIIRMDRVLCEIMLSNLFQNAVRHNVEMGKIKIELHHDRLNISNSGKQPIGKTERMFERMRKDNSNNESTGLGLAIVKKICDLNNFEVNYAYLGNLHVLKVDF